MKNESSIQHKCSLEVGNPLFLLSPCYVSGLKKKKREGKMFLKNFILKCFNYENRNKR